MAVSFFVNRLYVLTADGSVAYDERFHHGVNIIRGANSSGKSTITHLLFYALGGDYTQFVNEARLCSRVMAEVCMDGATITLSRPIDKDQEGKVMSRRGMTIHWGTLDEALADTCPSATYGYQTTAKSSSFSNVLFETMGMPIVQGDNNITMHQLLRLMYIDQESPTMSLFYYEQFDNQTTRETVADLLLGIFDEQLYVAKLRLKELDGELATAKANIKALEAALSPDQRSTKFISSLIDERGRQLQKLADDIAKLRQGEMATRQKKSQAELLKEELRKLEKQCEQMEEEADMKKYDVEDTRMFIEELRRKQMALNHSVSTREVLGSLRLEYCPECLSPLPAHTPEGTCHLCRQPADNATGVTQAKRLISELTFQIEESKHLLRSDEQSLVEAKAKLRNLKARRKIVRRNLDELLGYARSSVAEAIEDLTYKRGVISGELTQYYTMLEMAEKYELLMERKEQIEADIDDRRKFVREKTAQQEIRRVEAMRKIQLHGAYFLNHDQVRQMDFHEAKPSDFIVDFPNNMVFLQNRFAKYSASSSFLLKLVARFALFFASLDISWMRYPRFIFADNMEDKGIEMDRAQEFQRTLIERLSQYDADSYQVIYTTSYITEELDHSSYVVGEHYDVNNKSLKNV